MQLCWTQENCTTKLTGSIKLRSHERFYVSVAHFIWRPTRKKPLGGEVVELERVLLQLASDTVIYATANQRWTADGRRATSHVFRVAIASQWLYSPCSSSFQMRLTYLGRTSQTKIARVTAAFVSRQKLDSFGLMTRKDWVENEIRLIMN